MPTLLLLTVQRYGSADRDDERLAGRHGARDRRGVPPTPGRLAAPFGLTGPGCAGEVEVDGGSGGSAMTVRSSRQVRATSSPSSRSRRTLSPDRSCATSRTHLQSMATQSGMRHGLPFVMGTTAATATRLWRACAIVHLRRHRAEHGKADRRTAAALEQMADEFPSSFAATHSPSMSRTSRPRPTRRGPRRRSQRPSRP